MLKLDYGTAVPCLFGWIIVIVSHGLFYTGLPTSLVLIVVEFVAHSLTFYTQTTFSALGRKVYHDLAPVRSIKG